MSERLYWQKMICQQILARLERPPFSMRLDSLLEYSKIAHALHSPVNGHQTMNDVTWQ